MHLCLSSPRQLFRRKPIAELLVEGESPYALKRALGAGDLIMLGIGAVIGAGIFGAIGTAAAGQYDAAGHPGPSRGRTPPRLSLLPARAWRAPSRPWVSP